MKGRGLVVVLALVLATVATAGVFLYARGVEEKAEAGGTMVSVIVSKVEIPARSELNDYIKSEAFKTIQVPEGAVVDGAVTSVDQLRNKNNAATILAGEQIPNARISGNITGGVLSIPEGMQALNVGLESQRAIAGVIAPGDHVTLYGTYSDFTDTRTGDKIPTMTSVLVPTVEVLAVYRPTTAAPGIGDEETPQQTPGSGTISVTLALTPQDAQNFVFTMEAGRVWMGLLPPDETGVSLREVTLTEVVR